MFRILARSAPFVVIAAACATARATPFRQLPPKSSVEDVAIYTDARPDRPYEEVGLIEVQDLGLGGGYGGLITRARQEAAHLGADAIIVTRTPRKHETTVGTVSDRNKRGQRQVTTSTIEGENAGITVTAIVWKPEGEQRP